MLMQSSGLRCYRRSYFYKHSLCFPSRLRIYRDKFNMKVSIFQAWIRRAKITLHTQHRRSHYLETEKKKGKRRDKEQRKGKNQMKTNGGKKAKDKQTQSTPSKGNDTSIKYKKKGKKTWSAFPFVCTETKTADTWTSFVYRSNNSHSQQILLTGQYFILIKDYSQAGSICHWREKGATTHI